MHNWVCLFEFGMRLCVTKTAPKINSISIHVINSLHAVNFLRLLLSSADLKSKLTFSEILTGTLSECEMVCIQIKTDALLVLKWVQTICKCYQLTRKEWGT